MIRRRVAVITLALLLGGSLAAACDSGGGTSTGDPLALIGRDFEDPAVMDLARRLCNGFPNDNVGNIKCLAQGFELNLMTNLSVGSVTLYNQEAAGFGRFQGPLPGDLTWSDRYPSVLDKLGTPDGQYGGNGVDVWLLYERLGGYRVEVHFDAFHNNPEDLINSQMHYIHVSS